tara:strand:- start:234 stop:599 length:366 start_codon:yes stop_codon:yes gene_type:complete
MSDNNHSGSGANYFRGLLTGALLGAGLYYFFTSTKEGQQLGKQIKEKGRETLDDLIQEVEVRGAEFKVKAKQIQAQLEEKAQSLQTEVAEEAREQLAHIDVLRERGREAAHSFTRNGKSLS